MPQKTDAAQIRASLNALREHDWLKRTERRVWPRFAFHYTDLRNAAEILKAGRMLSRQQILAAGGLRVSSGSGEVLSATDGWVKDCVRFYFRPKTPTQYWAEGVKSRESLAQSKFPDAHCPVPVFFLFDLPGVLCLPDSRFSDRGLGAHNYRILSTADELETLQWKKIYHSGALDMTKESDIITFRQAEIVVPRSIGLDLLRYVYCRSSPELETLLHLLPEEVRARYQGRILSSSKSDLFYRQHAFLEDVNLSTEAVRFTFSPDSRSQGPFELNIEFRTLSGQWLTHRTYNNFHPVSEGSSTWRIRTTVPEYEVLIYLDDALIYAQSHVDSDIPF